MNQNNIPKHTVNTYTHPSLIKPTREPNHVVVTVYWRVDYSGESCRIFDLPRIGYVHNRELFKRGIGRIEVTLTRYTRDKKQACAYAEAIAICQIIDIASINCFGIHDVPNMKTKTVRRDAVELFVSHELTASCLLHSSRDVVMQNTMQHLAAYVYNTEVVKHVDPHLEEIARGCKVDITYHHKLHDALVYQSMMIRLPFGKVIVNWKSVDEYYHQPFIQYRIKEKGTQEVRPYDAVVNIVKNATELVANDDPYLARLRAKKGKNHYHLINNRAKVVVQLAQLQVPNIDKYSVIGFRLLNLGKEIARKIGYTDKQPINGRRCGR